MFFTWEVWPKVAEGQYTFDIYCGGTRQRLEIEIVGFGI